MRKRTGQSRESRHSQPAAAAGSTVAPGHRVFGGRAVQPLTIPPWRKLRVSSPDDASERDAEDRVARAETVRPDAVRPDAARPDAAPSWCEGRATETQSPRGGDHELVRGLGEGRALDTAARGLMESRFGRSFEDVRVHTGSAAAAAARSVAAAAFTVGSHIVFDAGEYSPHSPAGARLLTHELAHVAQAADDGVIRRQPHQGDTAAGDDSFLEWWKDVTGFEGSLEAWKKQPANKSDPGGPTNYGVTHDNYMANAKKLGLEPTEAGFAAMTPELAMRFGRLTWGSSGAKGIKNTGVAVVFADWFWGGIDLSLLTQILKDKGYNGPWYNQGMPTDEMIAFINTLPPDELVTLFSDAKAGQYRATAAANPSQKVFMDGQTGRSEKRRAQAQPFVQAPVRTPIGPPAPTAADKVADARAALDKSKQGSAALAPPPPGPISNLLTDASKPAASPFAAKTEPNPAVDFLAPQPPDRAKQAEAVANIFRDQRKLLVAEATQLMEMAAGDGTSSAKYHSRYRRFAALRDPWADQLAATIAAFKQEDEPGLAHAIERLEKNAAWLTNGGADWLAQVAPPTD